MTIGERIDRGLNALKGVFTSCFRPSEPPKRGLVIGSPTNFQHIAGPGVALNMDYRPLTSDENRSLLPQPQPSLGTSSEHIPEDRAAASEFERSAEDIGRAPQPAESEKWAGVSQAAAGKSEAPPSEA